MHIISYNPLSHLGGGYCLYIIDKEANRNENLPSLQMTELNLGTNLPELFSSYQDVNEETKNYYLKKKKKRHWVEILVIMDETKQTLLEEKTC